MGNINLVTARIRNPKSPRKLCRLWDSLAKKIKQKRHCTFAIWYFRRRKKEEEKSGHCTTATVHSLLEVWGRGWWSLLTWTYLLITSCMNKYKYKYKYKLDFSGFAEMFWKSKMQLNQIYVVASDRSFYKAAGVPAVTVMAWLNWLYCNLSGQHWIIITMLHLSYIYMLFNCTFS